MTKQRQANTTIETNTLILDDLVVTTFLFIESSDFPGTKNLASIAGSLIGDYQGPDLNIHFHQLARRST